MIVALLVHELAMGKHGFTRLTMTNAPPNSLVDLTTNLNVKTTEG
jgi:hypothetical protein